MVVVEAVIGLAYQGDLEALAEVEVVQIPLVEVVPPTVTMVDLLVSKLVVVAAEGAAEARPDQEVMGLTTITVQGPTNVGLVAEVEAAAIHKATEAGHAVPALVLEGMLEPVGATHPLALVPVVVVLLVAPAMAEVEVVLGFA